MIRREIVRVTSRLPKRLLPNSLTSLGKTGEVTQVTEVTQIYMHYKRERGVSLYRVYSPEYRLPGYLPLSSSFYLIDKKEKEERGEGVTGGVTWGNLTRLAVTGGILDHAVEAVRGIAQEAAISGAVRAFRLDPVVGCGKVSGGLQRAFCAVLRQGPA